MAAKYRDLRKTVIKLSEQQKMATTSESDIEYLATTAKGRDSRCSSSRCAKDISSGGVSSSGKTCRMMDFDPAVFLSEVLAQYYASDYVPREIYVPVDFNDRQLLEKALTKRRGKRVRIFFSQRGEKRDMIDLVDKNAKLAFEQRFRILKPDMKLVLEELQETLELPRLSSSHRIFRHLAYSGCRERSRYGCLREREDEQK